MKISAESINNLPRSWQLTPLGKLDKSGKINPKAPYLGDWEKIDLDRGFIYTEIESGKAVGIGLRLGKPSGYIVAIDFDGQSAIELGLEKFGELPKTVSWTSGLYGRHQALFTVPEQYHQQVSNKNQKTGITGTDGKAEQIEFRYTGNQSVLPPSPHPETDGYKWINNPIDTPIAELPQSAIDYWLSLIAPKVSKPKVTKSKSVLIDLPPIPLENCLAKSNREILKGIAEGGRNQAGATLARDLIGCANYLEAEGMNFKGDPRELFDRFVESCSPPINSDEADTIWRSAQGDNPEPSCRAEGIDNILEAWKNKHSPKCETQTDTDLKESITKALDLKNCEAPNLYGNSSLGRLFRQTAKNFNERLEIFHFISIPVLASRIKAETSLLVNPGSGFVVKPVRWCGLVGGTGTMKSPIINTVVRPLNYQQTEIWKQYQYDVECYDEALKDYEKLSKDEKKGTDEPKPPKQMQSVYFSDFTIEALTAAISEYPAEGTVIYSDELAGFFSSMDAYKSSAGVDRPKWLSIWDGGAIKSTRRLGSSYVPHSSISIIGGIQPGIIEAMIKKDKSKSDGLWARFTFMRIEHKITNLFSDIDGSLDEELQQLYKRIGDEPPQQHTIDIKARLLCTAWHQFLQEKIQGEGENNPMMVGVYAKMIGITFRNALILHRVYNAISETTPTQTIPLATIETAIAWTKFEMNQTLLEYQMLGLTDDDDPELARILKFINKFCGDTWLSNNPDGWVSPRDIHYWWFPKSTRKSDTIRKFMCKVVELGYGMKNDEPTQSSKFKIKLFVEKSAHKAHKMAVNVADKSSQPFTDKPTFFEQEMLETSHTNVWANTPTNIDNQPTLAHKMADIQSAGAVDLENVGFVGLDVENVGVLAHTLVNIGSGDIDHKNVGLGITGVNALSSKGSSDNVGFVGLISQVKLEIGDYAKTGDDIVVITEVKEDYIAGRDKDTNLIGGHPNLFTIASPEDFAATQGEVDDEWN